jgi:hypothetical protein
MKLTKLGLNNFNSRLKIMKLNIFSFRDRIIKNVSINTEDNFENSLKDQSFRH